MNGATIIIIFASVGFIVMGLAMLKSEKLENILILSNMYKDTKKYIKFNGKFNVGIGVIGLMVALINYFIGQESSYIVIVFIAIMLFATIIQKILGKKYKI